MADLLVENHGSIFLLDPVTDPSVTAPTTMSRMKRCSTAMAMPNNIASSGM